MAEADAEQRLAGLEQLADHRHRIFAGRRRVAGAVGEEQAVGLVRHHLLEGGGGGKDRDPRAGVGEVAEDVALGAVVDRDDVRPAVILVVLGIALAEPPAAAGPAVHLPARNLLGEVHAFEARPFARLGEQRLDVEAALDAVGDDAVGGAADADPAGQRPVSTPERPMRPLARIHSAKPCARPEAARTGHVLADDAASAQGLSASRSS